MFSLTQPTSSTLDGILRAQEKAEFSYPDVGATGGAFPEGYRHVREVVELGRGERDFLRAIEGLRRWQAHARAGVVLRPPDARVQDDVTVVLSVPLRPVYVTVACRIIYVVKEPTRFGYAYGTLPHHVIEGEESFLIEREDTDAVHFRISAFIRPRGPLMRASGPLLQPLDKHLVRRYMRGLQRHVAEQA